MQAYDNIALEYFYLGDLEKSKLYQDRMLRGKLEKEESMVKNVSLNMLNSKREKVRLGYRKLLVKQ